MEARAGGSGPRRTRRSGALRLRGASESSAVGRVKARNSADRQPALPVRALSARRPCQWCPCGCRLIHRAPPRLRGFAQVQLPIHACGVLETRGRMMMVLLLRCGSAQAH